MKKIKLMAVLLSFALLMVGCVSKAPEKKIWADGNIIKAKMEQGSFSDKAKSNLAEIDEKYVKFNGQDYKYQETKCYYKTYDDIEMLKSDLDMDIRDYSSDGKYLLEVTENREQARVIFSEGDVSGNKYIVVMDIFCETSNEGNVWFYTSSQLSENDLEEISIDENRKYYVGEKGSAFLDRQDNILYFMILNSMDEDVVSDAKDYFY